MAFAFAFWLPLRGGVPDWVEDTSFLLWTRGRLGGGLGLASAVVPPLSPLFLFVLDVLLPVVPPLFAALGYAAALHFQDYD